MSDDVFASPAVVAIPFVGSNVPFSVRRIFCVGFDYAEHDKEMDFMGCEDAFFSCKTVDALVVPDGADHGTVRRW